MLVLARRKEETIRIGDDIQIMVISISGSQVKLGIDAPADVSVVRCNAKPRKSRTVTNSEGSLKDDTSTDVATEGGMDAASYIADILATVRDIDRCVGGSELAHMPKEVALLMFRLKRLIQECDGTAWRFD